MHTKTYIQLIFHNDHGETKIQNTNAESENVIPINHFQEQR